jgi:hypothetical protein
MSEPQLPREVHRRLAIIQHAEKVTGNVAIPALDAMSLAGRLANLA